MKTDIPLKSVIKKLVGILGGLVGLIILYLLIRKAGLENLLTTFIHLDPKYLTLGIFFWILSLLVATYRFKKFCDIELTFRELFNIYLSGVILNYASAIQGLGIGAKIGLLKLNQVRVSKSAATISLEIIFDILFAGTIFMVFFIAYYDLIAKKVDFEGKFIFLGICAGVFVFVVFMARRTISVLKNFLEHLRRSFRARQFIFNFIITCLIWLLGALLMYTLVLAVGKHIHFYSVLFATSSAFILGLISFVPGGLGVRDAISALVLSLSGLPMDTAISIALINRIVSILTLILLISVNTLIRVLEARCKKEDYAL